MCCGCCCGVLRTLKLHPKPASIASSPFVAAVNVETCEGCGTCETRCQMEAVFLDNGTAALNLDRCIGCGLCVTTCHSESLSLVRKPEAEQPHVPKDIIDTLIKVKPLNIRSYAAGWGNMNEEQRILAKQENIEILTLDAFFQRFSKNLPVT